MDAATARVWALRLQISGSVASDSKAPNAREIEGGKFSSGFPPFFAKLKSALMLTNIIFWLTSVSLALLLLRVIRGHFAIEYPLFCAYLGYVLAAHITAFFVHSFRPQAYLEFYWYAESVGLALSYCVIWEIYGHVLRNFPGTAKIARSLVATFFICVLATALFDAFQWEASGLIKSVIRFERNVHAVQAVLVIVLLMLIRYYAIPLGRNLGGLVVGYGFLISSGVVTLTLRSYLGTTFQIWWEYVQPTSALIASLIWLHAFWTYVPNPELDVRVGLEEDYVALTEKTYRCIARARESVLRLLLP